MKTYSYLIYYALLSLSLNLVKADNDSQAKSDDTTIQEDYFKDNQSIHEAWTQLLQGNPKTADKLVPVLISGLIKENKYNNKNLYINLSDQLLKKFPHSAEYALALGLGYFQLLEDPNFTKNQTFPDKKPFSIRGQKFLWEAFALAKKQDKKTLAAHCALDLANHWLIDRQESWENPSLYRQLLENRDLNDIPKDQYYGWNPWAKVDFSLFKTPNSWESSKNDGERILWLLNQCKILDPKLTLEADLAWANIVRRESSLSYAPIGNVLPNAEHVQILKGLKDDQSVFIAPYGILPNDSSQQTIHLSGRENYLETYLTAYKENPENFSIAFKLATEFWNRSQFDRATNILKELEKNQANLTEKQRTILKETLTAISSPCIIAQTEYLNLPITDAPNNVVSVPIFYRNSPKETWTVSRLDMAKLSEEKIKELSSKKENLNYESFNYNVDPLLKAIEDNSEPLQKYLEQPVSFTIGAETAKPYQWYIGKMDVPIEEPGYYVVKSSNKDNPQTFLIHYSPIAYFIKQTDTGVSLYFYSRKTSKPIEGITGTLHLFYQDGETKTASTFHVRTDNQGSCDIIINQPKTELNHTDDKLDGVVYFEKEANSLIYTGNFQVEGKRFIIPPSYETIDLFDNRNKPQTDDMIFGSVIYDQPFYSEGDTIKGKVICGKPNINNPNTQGIEGTKVKLIATTYDYEKDRIFEKIYTLNKNGSFEFQLPIPQDFNKGNIYITLFDLSNEDKPSLILTCTQPIYVAGVNNDKFPYQISWHPGNDENTLSFKADSKKNTSPLDIRISTRLSPRYPYTSTNSLHSINLLINNKLHFNSTDKSSYSFISPHYPNDNPQYLGYEFYRANIHYLGETINQLLPAHFEKFTISALPKQNFGAVGMPYSIQWTAKNSNNINYSNVRGKISLVAKNQQQTAIQSWDIELNAYGTNKWEFIPTLSGDYLLISEWKHPNGQKANYTLPIFIAGNSEKTSFDSFNVIPEYPGYELGQPVNILITTAKDSQYVWLFLNHANIRNSKQLIKTSNHQYILTIPKEQTLQYPLSLSAVELNSAGPQKETIDINDPPANQCLLLTLTPNKEVYKIKEKGSVTVSVTHLNGEPVPNAEVCISIYASLFDDAMTWRLQNESLFQQMWGNSSHTLLNRELNILRCYNENDDEIKVDESYLLNQIRNSQHKSEHSLFLYRDNSEQQSSSLLKTFTAFPPGKDARPSIYELTMINSEMDGPMPQYNKPIAQFKWYGSIKTNSKGQASIPFTLPATPQEWTIKAWANTETMQYGNSSIRIKAINKNIKKHKPKNKQVK